MATLYPRDRSPKTVTFTFATGDVNGTSVASMRVMVRPPSGAEAEWTISGLTTSASEVSGYHTLHASGSDLPEAGTYRVRAFLYSAGGALLGESVETTFTVTAGLVGWPA